MVKTDIAAFAVLVVFSLVLHFAFVWDVMVRLGILKAGTMSEAIHEQITGQVSVAFLMGYLVCHLIRG